MDYEDFEKAPPASSKARLVIITVLMIIMFAGSALFIALAIAGSVERGKAAKAAAAMNTNAVSTNATGTAAPQGSSTK
jgi:flagellar basal body-associated protein FliL